MKKIFICLAFLCAQFIYGTQEQPDLLIYNGKTYEWTGYGYGYKYIKSTNLLVPEEAVDGEGNSDNQILIYKLEDGKLYFVDVQIHVQGKILFTNPEFRDIETKSIFSYYFPDNKPIFISEATEVVEIPDGEITGDDEYCYLDTFENYLVIQLKKGHVKQLKNINYEGLRQLRHAALKKLKRKPHYRQEAEKIIKELHYFNQHTCKKATIDQYLEYIIFRHNLSNKL